MEATLQQIKDFASILKFIFGISEGASTTLFPIYMGPTQH